MKGAHVRLTKFLKLRKSCGSTFTFRLSPLTSPYFFLNNLAVLKLACLPTMPINLCGLSTARFGICGLNANALLFEFKL
jgi:hypothetical protein